MKGNKPMYGAKEKSYGKGRKSLSAGAAVTRKSLKAGAAVTRKSLKGGK